MAVSRSHLHRSAARTACSREPSATTAISAASAATRRVLSPRDPSFAWKVTASSAARRAASGCLRSCSQKKAASARRGRTTRSLPARTVAGSRLSMLLTAMKAGSSRPCVSSTGKQRWWSSRVEISTSRGSDRKRSSKRPVSASGHSTSAVTSSSSAALISARPCTSAAAAVTSARMRSRRVAKSASTCPRSRSVRS